jgi:hypothetical protein
MDFFEIDDDLVAAASKASAENKDADEPDLQEQITKLSEQERTDFLNPEI